MNAPTLKTTQSSLAERIFDGFGAESELETQLYEAGMTEFERLGHDWYDCSLEIYGAPPAFRLSEEMQRICFDAGFAKVYVNHTDKWETHYNFGKEFKMAWGWRVSYPHKRGDTAGIWVEAPVPGSPVEWFKTGYAKVKEWLTSPT